MTYSHSMDRNGHGQILIVTAAAMVVLLGIAALVVDLGFAWMLHRQEQNAADPAAIAAARFIQTDQSISAGYQNAACWYAHQNGFFGGPGSTATCVPSNDPQSATLTVNYPPDSTAGQFAGQQGMVQVVISRQLNTFLGAVFGRASITVTTQAVAARQHGYANTHTLMALADTQCVAAEVHGSGTIHVYAAAGVTAPGGYVQVDSNCANGSTADDLCSNGTGALKLTGSAVLYAPRTDVVGSCQSASTGQMQGPLNEAAAYQGDPLASLRPPQFDPSLDGRPCGLSGTATQSTGNAASGCGSSKMPWVYSPNSDCPGLPNGYKCVELQPGVYYGGWNISSKLRVTLQPGIYIIAGGGLKIGSTGSLDSLDGGTTPVPVMIYNTDNPKATTCPGSSSDPGCQQDLTLTAGGSLQLAGLLKTSPCPPATTTGGCPYGGMVIWDDGNGSQGYSGNVQISGGTKLNISGTIYAPKANVEIDGNSGTNTAGPTCPSGATQVAAVQLISWTWNVGGTGDLCMPYDPTLLYQITQQGLVH